MSSKRGTFIISLDFELLWGMRELSTADRYRANLLGVRDAVAALLDVFAEYAVHATWAAVGFLFFDGRDELLASIPTSVPTYCNQRLSPYTDLESLGRNEKEDPLHFAPSLIRRIAEYRYQEVGTHTLSHYYCLEPGQDAEQFREDLQTGLHVAQAKFGLRLRSLVFPRNQVKDDYLPLCAELGIHAYRGNFPKWAQKPSIHPGDPPLRRLARLIDTYVPATGSSCYDIRCPDSAPCNLPGSLFLRPWSASRSAFEGLRLKRISCDLRKAAEQGHVFHLWWHPHNFGQNRSRNLRFLRRVLDEFAECRERFGMASLNMGELADQLLGSA